ncbi:MAG: C39 family peptidase [Pseudomonadales bacterium]|nr:C39 family peptidase [Pseudomonadales bacterium]
MKIVLLITINLFFIYFTAFNNLPMVSAQSIVFEDNFTNGFEKWESVRNNFDMWSIIEDQANVFIQRGSTLAELVPKDLYWNPEWKNISYEVDYKYLQGADKNISFGFKDIFNWYEIHFVERSYFLSHIKNGRVVWDQSGVADIIYNFTHHIKIRLNEGLIIVTIDDKEIINVIDPTFDNDYGKIGIKAGTGAVHPTWAIYDNIVVKIFNNLSKLELHPQKQTDQLWKNEEYDSAGNWANYKNIEQWGCLISSLSMVMNYHGITLMPDSSPVNPSTLNNWLKSQPDGYIGEGLVNWLSVTRLSKLISDLYQTPKLEYKRINSESLEEANNQIQKNNPVILQIPGHFFVGNGIIEESDQPDLYIIDPSYNYEKFSQHKELLLSTRILEPTFSDLSYIHLSFRSDLNVSVTNVAGEEIENIQFFDDYLRDFFLDENVVGGGYTQNNSPITNIIEIEKPTSDIYKIEVSQNKFGPFNLSIFTYTKSGELTNLTYSGIVGINKLQLKLIYNNEGISILEEEIDLKTIANDIEELFDEKEIMKHYVYLELKKYVNLAINSGETNTERYLNALTDLINWYSPQITETGFQYLIHRSSEIKGIIQR